MEYRIKIVIGAVSGSSYFGYRIGTTINLAGSNRVTDTQIKSASTSQWTTPITYESAWYTVANKTTGTTPLKITLTTSAPRGNKTWSYSLAVDASKSTMTVPTFTANTAGTFSITRYNSSFTHTITFSIGSAGGTIANKTTSTSVSWTPPMSLYLQMIGKNSASGTVTLETFSDSTSLGKTSYALKVNAESVYNPPSISDFSYERGSYVDSTWESDDNGSDAKITFTAAVPSVTGNTTTAVVKIGTTTVSSGALTSGDKTYYATGIGTDTSVKITVTITDTISGERPPYSLVVPSVEVPMNINLDLPGVAFGKVSEYAKTVELAEGWTISQNGAVLPDIRFGTASKQVSAGVSTLAITFGAEMRGSPRVFLCPVTTEPQNFSLGVQDASTTGFTAEIYSATAVTRYFYWLAVG